MPNNNKLRTLILSGFLMVVLTCCSNTDSGMDTLAQKANPETGKVKINALLETAKINIEKNPDEMLKLSKTALSLAEKENYGTGIAKSKYFIGVYEAMHGRFEEAFSNFTVAFNIFDQSGNDEGLGLIYNAYGMLFNKNGEYQKAVKYFLKSVSHLEKAKDDRQLIVSLLNLGVNYFEIQQYNTGLEVYLKALRYACNLKDTTSIAKCYNNIGNIYYEMDLYEKAINYHKKSLALKQGKKSEVGIALSLNNIANVYLEWNKHDEALAHYQKARDILLEKHDSLNYCMALLNIGNVYYSVKDYKHALVYFDSSLKLSELISNKKGIANAYHQMGLMYFDSKNFREAVKNFEKGAELFDKESMLYSLKEGLDKISEAYYQIGDFKKSSEYRNRFALLTEKIIKSDLENDVANINRISKYDEKIELLVSMNRIKEKHISELRILIIILSTMFLALCAFTVLLLRSRIRIKRQNAILEKNTNLIMSVHNSLSKGLDTVLFPISYHFSKLEKNEENMNSIETYTILIQRLNALRKEIISNN